jgi:tetratricopeptide (TPR) repeat protein
VYLPSLAVLLGLAAALVWVLQVLRPRWRKGAVVIMAGGLVGLATAEAVITSRYVGYWQDTMSLYEHMLRVTPNSEPLYMDMGIWLCAQGKVEEGIASYRRALALEPNEAFAHFNLASQLSRSKEGREEAISHLRQILHHYRLGARAHVLLATLLKDSGQTGEAVKLLQAALRMDPAEGRIHLCLGHTLPMIGQPGEAVVHLREAIRVSPEPAPALTQLAWLLATHVDPNIRDSSEAVALGKRAVYLAGLIDGKPFDALAAAYAAQGDFGLAVETAENAVKTADRRKQSELAGQIRQRLELYRQRKPYSEDPAERDNVVEPNAVRSEGCSEPDMLGIMEEPHS